MKRIVFLFTILITLFILIGCSDSNSSTTTSVNKGESAPQFTLKDIDGNDVKLTYFAGEKVYVKYWASWCSICLAGLEDLDILATEDKDFKVLSIVSPNFNAEKPAEKFIKWYERLDTKNIPVLLDEDGLYATQFKVIAYPTSYYIGTDGVLVKMIPGHNTNEQIKTIMAGIK